MIVVSDTSPLTALITIQQIDLLQQLYDEVKIPPAVAEEKRGREKGSVRLNHSFDLNPIKRLFFILNVLNKTFSRLRGNSLDSVVLRFLLSDCLLFSVTEDDSQRKQNTVRNPHEPPIRIWQCKKQAEKQNDGNPTHSRRFNHEGSLTRPACVLDAEISPDDSSGEADYAASDSSDPSPHGSCVHPVILFAERLM